jgi:hypothetical protein
MPTTRKAGHAPEVSIYLRMHYTGTVSIRLSPCSKAGCGVAIDSLDPPSRQSIEYFREAHGGFAIWLDPFGIFDPQVVVDLFPEFGVVIGLVRHGNWLGEDSSARRLRRPALAP